MKEKYSEWDDLLLKERQVENELDEITQVQRDAQRIEEQYEELFFYGSQLIDRLETFVKAEKYAVEDLQWSTKQKQQGILYHLDDQKEQIHKEKRMIEDQQDDLFYEKKRILAETENMNEY